MADAAVTHRLRHLAEALGAVLALALFRLLPVEAASNLGGWLGRSLGPRLPVTRRARRNLRLAFPAMAERDMAGIIEGMWDNLGRTLAEYPHLGRITAPEADRVEFSDLGGGPPLTEKLRPGILVSAHLANWEVMPVMAGRLGIELAIIERAPNNPLVGALLERLRGVGGGRRLAKGARGAREAMALLAGGGALGILADQKSSDGIAVSFFGHEAMTSAGPAQLALRFGCPLIPARIERLGPARFRLTCHAPLDLPQSGDRQQDLAALTLALNRLLEGWIREKPEEWLWLHRRWPAAAYRQAESGAA
jgi:KDO2-lipid IV(A) lauroyltransferase